MTAQSPLSELAAPFVDFARGRVEVHQENWARIFKRLESEDYGPGHAWHDALSLWTMVCKDWLALLTHTQPQASAVAAPFVALVTDTNAETVAERVTLAKGEIFRPLKVTDLVKLGGGDPISAKHIVVNAPDETTLDIQLVNLGKGLTDKVKAVPPGSYQGAVYDSREGNPRLLAWIHYHRLVGHP